MPETAQAPEALGAEPVPHSAIRQRVAWPVPVNACDAHLHIYDARFHHTGTVPAQADVAGYRQLQNWLGTRRAVIVQPRLHGSDNRVTLDAIAQLGIAQTRGIAVVPPNIDDAGLAQLHEGGIRGIRLSLHVANQHTAGLDDLPRLAARVHELGWHVQLHLDAQQIVAHHRLLQALPAALVFDHMARIPVAAGTAHPAFALVRALLENERVWLKLSGFYLDAPSIDGAWPHAQPLAQAWVQAAPHRLVWGSDWPHITETRTKPDDAALLQTLAAVCPTPEVLVQILVDNPARLYGFVD